ncbi:hypothetical protein C8Q78DRAFT_223231 [Trametes maxima]|nr:hypothetical protein C8Q78DRAFT_223231 [Trametes maxima]
MPRFKSKRRRGWSRKGRKAGSTSNTQAAATLDTRAVSRYSNELTEPTTEPPVELFLNLMAKEEVSTQKCAYKTWRNVRAEMRLYIELPSGTGKPVAPPASQLARLYFELCAYLPDDSERTYTVVLDHCFPRDNQYPVPFWYYELDTDEATLYPYIQPVGWLHKVVTEDILSARSSGRMMAPSVSPWWHVLSFIHDFKAEYRKVCIRMEHAMTFAPVRHRAPSEEV